MASASESETTSSSISSHDSSSQTRQRKRIKWDQPAKSLAFAGPAVPGVVSLAPLLQQHAGAIVSKLNQSSWNSNRSAGADG
ncbi:hypothetical protein TIFTF001_029199 [Ficus carica]|uniref:Uncharacterized protein n=1 Tax=Ficus carica TaxID=3494 RepID=A0AA88DRD3_FICCA|nr:hypothetical protein TIFTF001_029199 [Ficus carica]